MAMIPTLKMTILTIVILLDIKQFKEDIILFCCFYNNKILVLRL